LGARARRPRPATRHMDRRADRGRTAPAVRAQDPLADQSRIRRRRPLRTADSCTPRTRQRLVGPTPRTPPTPTPTPTILIAPRSQGASADPGQPVPRESPLLEPNLAHFRTLSPCKLPRCSRRREVLENRCRRRSLARRPRRAPCGIELRAVDAACPTFCHGAKITQSRRLAHAPPGLPSCR
jgi:hypothetical protein